MDVVYGTTSPIGASTSSPSAEDTGTEVNLWRIWVSPKPFTLSIDQATGAVSQVHRSAAATEGALNLDPAPLGTHEAGGRRVHVRPQRRTEASRCRALVDRTDGGSTGRRHSRGWDSKPHGTSTGPQLLRQH